MPKRNGCQKQTPVQVKFLGNTYVSKSLSIPLLSPRFFSDRHCFPLPLCLIILRFCLVHLKRLIVSFFFRTLTCIRGFQVSRPVSGLCRCPAGTLTSYQGDGGGCRDAEIGLLTFWLGISQSALLQ